MEKFFKAERFDAKEKGQLVEEIFNFCLSRNIPFINAIGYFTELYIFESQVASHFITQNYAEAMSLCTPKITDEQFKAYFEPIMNGFTSSLEPYLLSIHKDNEFYETIIANTYDTVIEGVRQNDVIQIPLRDSMYSESLDNEIVNTLENEKSILTDYMKNKKKFIHMGSDSHFLRHLQDDTLERTEDGKLIFGNHSKALSIAYRNQKAMLSIRKEDKDAALRDLRTKLKHLEYYKNIPGSELLIPFTKGLIAFIEQRKNKRIVPIVILAKELGMPASVALKYAKQVLSGTINDSSFKKNFEEINRID
jgi:hypothetical protein